jgi:preprotein translocase subunit SecE
MFTGSRYKRSQGRIARQATFFAIVATVVIGAWRVSDAATAGGWAWLVPDAWETYVSPLVLGEYIVPAILAAIGIWIAFRIVNIPNFADFLISVEAEMNKVSWPSRGELFRASMVVIVVIFLLTAVLFGYDVLLKYVITQGLGLGGGD